MKSLIQKVSIIATAIFLSSALMCGGNVMAEETEADVVEEAKKAATSISISPVSKVLQLEPSTVYEDSFKISNNGSSKIKFEVYAAPYSYTFSEDEDAYKLGFSRENNYTQIVRWVTFRDVNGNYVEKTTFTAEPGESVEVSYKISTPASVPDGGQYAVLFAHTLSDTTTGGGIKTEASPGLVVYGRTKGNTVSEAQFSNLQINQTKKEGEKEKSIINATAKIKNDGNVDFTGAGKLKITGLFGRVYYETASDRGRISVIPESELVVSDEWEETPYFGLFNVTWTVSAIGKNESITKMILILPAPIIVALILLLTIIIVWIIVMVRKRKERKSRFMA